MHGSLLIVFSVTFRKDWLNSLCKTTVIWLSPHSILIPNRRRNFQAPCTWFRCLHVSCQKKCQQTKYNFKNFFFWFTLYLKADLELLTSKFSVSGAKEKESERQLEKQNKTNKRRHPIEIFGQRWVIPVAVYSNQVSRYAELYSFRLHIYTVYKQPIVSIRDV